MATLRISIDRKLDVALERVARRTGKTKSAVAREFLARQLSVQRFRELRAEVLPFAEAQGLVEDVDIFRLVS
jgi:predicted transcriptional regulator